MSDSLPPNTVFPNEEAQKRYSLEAYPCRCCSNLDYGLPFLVDNSAEFYWHHVHPVGKSRDGCSRFGTSERLGARPREGTAVATYNRGELRKRQGY